MTNGLVDAYLRLKKFLLHPEDRHHFHLASHQKFRRLTALLLLELPVMLFFILGLYLLQNSGYIDLGEHVLERMMREKPALVFLTGVLFAPLIEETLFRFFITYRRAFYFLWPTLLYAVVAKKNRWAILYRTRQMWTHIFPYVYYGSCVVFGLVHGTNFENLTDYIWITPIITLPQMVVGIILGYVRVKFGILWSMIFHALHNAIFMAPVFLFDL